MTPDNRFELIHQIDPYCSLVLGRPIRNLETLFYRLRLNVAKTRSFKNRVGIMADQL